MNNEFPSNKQGHEPQNQIDDPSLFLNLDHPHPYPSQEDKQQEHYEKSIHQQPNQEVEEDNHQQQNNFEGEEQKQQYFEENQHQNHEIMPQQHAPLTEDPKTENLKQEDFSKKEKKKKTKKKQTLSDDDFSDQYVSNKRGRGRGRGRGERKIVKTQQPRGRGKPRGRIPGSKSRNFEIKKQLSNLHPIPEFKMTDERKAATAKRITPPPLPENVIIIPPQVWRHSEDNQQDFQSQNASIWSRSVSRRQQCLTYHQIQRLVQSNSQNIISKISQLPAIYYMTH